MRHERPVWPIKIDYAQRAILFKSILTRLIAPDYNNDHQAQIMLSLQACFNKYSLYEAKTGINMGCLFYHSLRMVGLSYANPPSAGISRYNCPVQETIEKKLCTVSTLIVCFILGQHLC